MLRRHFMLALAAALPGCTAVQEIAALRSVNFRLDRVTALSLAGVDLSAAQTASDLSLSGGTRVAAALARGQLPLSMTLHVLGENPASNPVAARLLRMRWTLLLEDKETVSGLTEHAYELMPGRPTDIPVDVSLDLLEFFERSGPDLMELALNLAGAGGRPKRLALRATPTVDTPLGPIAYPRPITIAAGSVGHS
jgi:hypothetical protein